MEIKARHQKFFFSAAGVALLGLIVILVNVLAGWTPIRLDLTQGQVYSLSGSSKRLIKDLPDPVILKAYFSPDLPPPYNTFERYTRDLLKEYRAASRGKIRAEFVLPFPVRDFETKAAQANLAPVQFEQMGSDQMSIRRAFMGLTMFYRDKVETIPLVRNPQLLEYELTSRLAKMIDRPKKNVALSAGHGELPWRNPQSSLAQELEALFAFQELTLPVTAQADLAKADALLVVGPQLKFDSASLASLDQWFESGKPLGLLVQSANFMPQQFGVLKNDSGLKEWLALKGIHLDERLVLDVQAESVGLTQNIAGLALTSQVRYPFVPLISDLAKDHPLTRGLSVLGLPFVTRVERSTGAHQPGITYMPLFKTSVRSWLAPATLFSAAPDRIPPPVEGEPQGPFAVGAVVEGGQPAKRLVVIGTAHFLNPQLPEFSGAGAFMTNLLSYLTGDDTLAGIRAKTDILRPLKPVKDGVRELIKILAVLGVPLLAALLGLWRWSRRKTWRKQVAADYQKS